METFYTGWLKGLKVLPIKYIIYGIFRFIALEIQDEHRNSSKYAKNFLDSWCCDKWNYLN